MTIIKFKSDAFTGRKHHQIKSIWIIFIFLLFSVQGNAKDRFGFKVGTSASNFYYTDVNLDPRSGLEVDLSPYLGYDITWVQLGAQKPLFSPYISIYYDKKLSDKFSLRPELSYTKKGVSFSQSDYEGIIYKVQIGYLEIPVSLVYQLSEGSKVISELYTGVYGAFKVDSVKKVAYQNSSIEKTPVDTVNNFDWGIHFGAALKHRFLKKFFIFDIRLFLGFNDVFFFPDAGIQKYIKTQNTKNAGLYLTVGYEL